MDSPGRGVALLVLLVVGLGGASSAAGAPSHLAGQWPQWRGPEGLGVTSDGNLPQRWSEDSENIRWKARIPGLGHSSPVVSNGRVFVTTAYEDSAPGVIRRLGVGLAGLLTAVFLAAVVARLVLALRASESGPARAAKDAPGRLPGRIVACISTVLFFLALVMMFVFPEQYDATAGEFLADTLGTYDTEHVFYVGKEVAAATWLNTGALALLGWAVALYWIRAHSIWRPLGGLAFVPLAVALVALTPLDAWKYPIVLWTRALFVVPGALVAAWHLLGYLELRRVGGDKVADGCGNEAAPPRSAGGIRISRKYKNLWRIGSKVSLVAFTSMALLAAVAFVPVNLLLPNRGMHRAVVCLDVETGRILWQRRVFTSPAERKHRENSYATPTPATDGRRVIANFGVGVVCLDLDGQVVWKTLDPKYPGDTRYGAVSSVLRWQDRVIVLQESEENTKRTTWLAAFEKTSGDVLWRTKPSGLHMAYTTGLLYEDGDGAKLIVATFERIFCFDVVSGQLLWEDRIPMQQLVAGFARSGNVICIGGGTWGESGLLALRLGGPEEARPFELLWRASEDTPGCASPVIYNGILFTITDTGVMRAYDVASGKLHWRKRLRGRYLASLLAGDGKVYACSTNGWTTIVAAEPEMRILGRNRLSGDCRASIAVTDSHFLVRTSDFLYCIAP